MPSRAEQGAEADAAEPSPSAEPEPAGDETAEDQPAKPAADAS